MQAAAGKWHQARDTFEQQLLPRSFQPGQPDHFARRNCNIHISQHHMFTRKIRPHQFQLPCAQRRPRPRTNSQLLAKHHLHQRISFIRRLRFTCQLAAPQHRHAPAQSLHIFQLVRNKNHSLALRRQLAQRGEQLHLLIGRNASSRLIQNKNPRTQPQQARNLQLLALANRQVKHVSIHIEPEFEFVTQRSKLRTSFSPPLPKLVFAPQQKIVEDAHGRKVKWILVQHAHTMPQRSRRRAQAHRRTLKQYFAAVRVKIA